MRLLKILWYYWQARRLRFTDRGVLERYQQRRLSRFTQRFLRRSPYFSAYCEQSLTQWPMMDKALMMRHFDSMNTQNLKVDELFACAKQSEFSRDFSPTVGQFSVGLSSGTSGKRGIFVVSPDEQARWSGTMLAKMLPDGLFAGERVALFLRANNNLYESVNNRWLSFQFYDLLGDFDEHLAALNEWQPTIIVAPAQVLVEITKRQLRGECSLTPKKVISVAEVLAADDKALLQSVFLDVGEVYQATEGFLGCTCAHGTLHLNEAFLYIEKRWIDERRFLPIITDFTRQTQPIVRYQLDDILVARETPCPCGDAQLAIERIEGRSDDQLVLTNQQGEPITLFADACNRVICNTLPTETDYRLHQQGQLFTLSADCEDAALLACKQALTDYFELQGAVIAHLQWQFNTTLPVTTMAIKRRRITREAP
ncbi:F390 synthetase-related protein [Providencia alcalifaciens]|uniref:Adenylate-forming enzyme n=1 Tax=Providencia alcalifaciens 205/92 TaxID=1256988 RepID=A0AAV3M357_9GAMM|nr:F390 synthetase-related protein [Providencia alcalifaciens]EUD09995.1 putative adenylate-forming enzyme [Providencia alcalifaciens 205/92]MTC62894.1 CoF synthetase [Providencia alcalifaciens]WGZ55252.1 CoF synthetase [Providencia alcalifaciens]